MEQATLFGGRYHIVEVLGDGGMARVYKAMDERLGRLVAIKTLHAQYNNQPEFITRFEQEAQLAASLSHPNIISVYDIGHDDDGPYYIVMEYVEGENLKSLIRREAPLKLSVTTSICRQLCQALDFAHERGVVHRDIKPENIFLTPTRQVKVGDFGIARALASAGMTMTGTVLGSVSYFSPEQAQGQPATAQSDLYSTGIVLYEMLTSHLPFVADNALAVAMKHITEAPAPPSALNAHISPGVDAVVLKSIAKDPARRYRTGADLASALTRETSSAIATAASATEVRPVRPAPPHGPTTTPAMSQTRRPPVTRNVNAAPVKRAAPPNRQRPIGPVIVILALLAALAGGIIVGRGGIQQLGLGDSVTPTPTAVPGVIAASSVTPTSVLGAIGASATPTAQTVAAAATATVAPRTNQPTNTSVPLTPLPGAVTSTPAPSTTPAPPGKKTPVAHPPPPRSRATPKPPTPPGKKTPVAPVKNVHATLTFAGDVSPSFAPVDPRRTFDTGMQFATVIAHWTGAGPGHAVSFRWTTPSGSQGRWPDSGSGCPSDGLVCYVKIFLAAPGTYQVGFYIDNTEVGHGQFTVVQSSTPTAATGTPTS